MRTMITISMSTEAGNKAIKDGSLSKLVEGFMNEYKPEAAYFTAVNGERTAIFVIDMADSSQIPAIAEPFFMGLNAKIEFKPAMNADDLRAGLQKALI